jgi:alkanesulfonate monooxygenase SsuD/methylene tetrahydromethanopterin reductase-like flavin-dependent oxidoreductase (luciferase family)
MRLGYGLLSAQRHPDDPRPWSALYREVVEYGVLAERAGLDSFWTSEHHFVDDGYMPAQLPVLAAVAARTERIRLGTGVLLAPMFDPLRLAEDAATVDLLAGGRLILGLGIGWRDEEFDGFAVPTRERGRRLEGTIAVLRQAWGDGLVTGDGDRFAYPAPGLNVTPKPERGAATPIWIGAGAEPAVRRAGRIADGYLGSSASVRAIGQRAGWVRDEAEAVGRDPVSIEIGVHRMTFAWRDGDPWDRVRDAAHYLSWKYEDMSEARGSIERHRPPALDAAAEAALRSRVVAGTPEQVADEIRAYAPVLSGNGSFVFRGHFPGLDPAIQREAFDTLVEEVVPLLRT